MTRLVKGVHLFFALIFVIVIIGSITRPFVLTDGNEAYVSMSAEAVVSLILGIVFVCAMPLVYGFAKKHLGGLSAKQCDKIFIAMAAVVFTLQIACMLLLKARPVNDLRYITTAAKNFCVSWNTDNLYDGVVPRHYGRYFARYPNNHMLFAIVAVIYRISYLLFGKAYTIVPMFVNTVLLFASYVMSYFIAKKLFKNSFDALFCAAVMAVFPVFYSYTPFFYTDSMSMPFTTGSILLLLTAENCGEDMKKKKYVCLVLSALALGIGYKIKGSVVILIPAYILFFIAKTKKENVKSTIVKSAAVVAGAAAAVLACTGIISTLHLATEEDYERYEFPAAHWIMMSLRNPGGYNDADFFYTEQFESYEEKKEADIAEIKRRVSDYGFTGMVAHLIIKSGYTWGDGKYFISKYLKEGIPNPVRTFIGESSVFRAYSQAFQYMLLAGVLYSFILGWREFGSGKEKYEQLLLLRIIFCGVYFFFLIWEARSRYLVNFSPIFVMLAVSSVICAYEKHNERKLSHDGASN